MSLQPHPTDQVGQLADPLQPFLYRTDHLVGAGERIPNLDDELALRAPVPTSRVTLSDGRLSRLSVHVAPTQSSTSVEDRR